MTSLDTIEGCMSLPEWRRPFGVIRGEDAAARERRSIAEAIWQLVGREPLTTDELRAAVVEMWGDPGEAFVVVVRSMVRGRELRHVEGGYVR
jgi:hypothetical protein